MDGDRDGGLAGQFPRGAGQAEFGEVLRPDALHDLPERDHQVLGLLVRDGQWPGGGRVVGYVEPGQSQLEGEAGQPGLRAVVHVALDAPAFRLVRVDQAGP